MFELTIKCSKDVKKIVIDFGDDQSAVTEVNNTHSESVPSPKLESPIAPLDMADILASRASTTSIAKPERKAKTENTSGPAVPDISNRPPKVDEDFNVEF